MKYLAVFALAASAAAQNWTDRAEYDLVLAIRAEADAAKKIALLEQWETKYPKSELTPTRRELYLATLQSTGAWPRMFEAAKTMMTELPTSLTGTYWTAVLAPATAPTEGAAAAAVIQTGADAAKKMLEDPAWQPHLAEVELLARRTLAWAHWQKGEFTLAEQELNTLVQKDPDNAEASSWMGLVLLLQKQQDKQIPAIWHLARASQIEGPRSLPDTRKREIRTLFERIYASYHGSSEGIEQIASAAKTQVLPPEGFKIESGAEIAARREDEELARTNPERWNWMKIRRALQAPQGGGEEYFATLKGVAGPKLKGTILRFTPANRPKELVIAIAEPGVEEVVLQLETALAQKVEAGWTAEFTEAVPVSWSAAPFTVTMTIPREKVAVLANDAVRQP